MRRPPLRLVTAGPGGLGQSSAGTRTGCLRWLDAGVTTGGGSHPGRRLVCLRCASRKHGAGDRKAAMERRVAIRALARRGNAARRWTDGCAARRSIPLWLKGKGAKPRRACPGPRQRIRAAEPWLGCLKSESVRGGMTVQHIPLIPA